MESPSTVSTPSTQDFDSKVVQPVKSFFENVATNLSKGNKNLAEKAAPLLSQIKHAFSYYPKGGQKTYYLKKGGQKNSDSVNSRFEAFFNSKKFQEAADLYMEDNNSSEIKTYSFNSFIDRLSEAGHINIFFDILNYSIQNHLPVLGKYTLKKFYNSLTKANKATFGQGLLDTYLTALKEGESRELLYRIYQYYISACFKVADFQKAFDLFDEFKKNYVAKEEHTPVYYKIYEIMIKGCISEKTQIEKAKQVLEEVSGQKPNDVFFNKLIDFSAKHHDLSFSEYIFKVMVSHTIQPSIVTYNTLIDSYFKQNKYNQAWILFELLKKSDKKPDNFTYTTMINGIKSMEKPDLNKAFTLFNEYKEINKADQIIYNCLIDACINAGNFEKATQLLEEMKKDTSLKLDEITFNTLIKGCCKSRKLQEAVGFFEDMKKLNIKPNRITFNSLIDTCVKTRRMNDAWRIYEEMMKCDIKADNFTYSILVNGIKSNNHNKDELTKALTMLDMMQNSPAFAPDEIFYNSLIDACIKFNEINKGLSLFEEMKKKKIEPSSITYGILIKAFGKMNDLVKAFKIFEQMKLKNMRINDVTYGCLLDACVKNDRMDLALILVDKLKQDNISLNTILYTTLIKGFSKANKLEDALRIFKLMKEDPKTSPNLITYNCILDACVKNDNMAKAQEIFDEMNTAKVFTPDLITFSTMIKGFCKQRNIEKAFQNLTMIINSKITPDEALINLMLECCYTTGNMDRGVEIFNVMNNLKITASNITYSIMIKLYGKARKIHKVMGVLETMKRNKVKPGLITYTNLIQACFKAKKLEFVLDVLKDLDSSGMKLDGIFYSKVISGFIGLGKIEFATKYIRGAIGDRINLGSELQAQIIHSLGESSLTDKQELIDGLQNNFKFKGSKEPTLKENYSFLNKQAQSQNRQSVSETINIEENTQQPKKKFFNNRQKKDKENNEKPSQEEFKNSDNIEIVQELEPTPKVSTPERKQVLKEQAYEDKENSAQKPIPKPIKNLGLFARNTAQNSENTQKNQTSKSKIR